MSTDRGEQPVLVTIVIPTYNDDPEHLTEAVTSARAQTHPATEVIVVDDGSTRTETVSALDALESVTVIRQANAGPSTARNAGIRAGRGEVVICLDADDVLSSDYAAEAVHVLSTTPTATIAYPRMEPFGETPGPVWPTRGRLSISDFAQRSAVACSSAFRQTDWIAAGGWDEAMRTGMEDHEWWIRLLGRTAGAAVPLPRATLGYRIRRGSRSRSRPYAADLAVTRRQILANNPPEVLQELLEGAWAQTDRAEAEAARAWSDPWQLRRWGTALGRRARRRSTRSR